MTAQQRDRYQGPERRQIDEGWQQAYKFLSVQIAALQELKDLEAAAAQVRFVLGARPGQVRQQ